MELWDRFKDLPVPLQSTELESLSAEIVLEGPHRIAKDSMGAPALLLASTGRRSEMAFGLRLKHIEVQHQARCRVTAPDGASDEAIFSIVRLKGADELLVRHFLSVVEPVIRMLGQSPEATDISKAVTRLVELFRALEQPSLKAIAGLWAELFVVSRAVSPSVLLAAWHNCPGDRYDFSAGPQRLEVKGSSVRQRIHHFSLAQLSPPQGCKLVVASVLVERAGAGQSLGELVEQVRRSVSGCPDLQHRIDQVVSSTLGASLHEGLSERMDRELARDSLLFFSGELVPTIPGPVPPEVSDVHFKANLEGVEPLKPDELVSQGGLFAALVASA